MSVSRAEQERKRAANLKRKKAMLARHYLARDPVTGKSRIAQAGGRAAARKLLEEDPEGPSAWGVRMALRRWHRDAVTGENGGAS